MSQKPIQRAPKHRFKAARPGDHFLSERPEKCVPMAGGSSVTSIPKQMESDPNNEAAEKKPAEAGFLVLANGSSLRRDYLFSAAGAAGAAAGASAGALTAGGWAAAAGATAWLMGNKGTISKATMLMILIKGLTAGPAVSL